MLFFVLALVFLYQYLVVYIRGKHDWQLKLKRIASTDSDFLTDVSLFGLCVYSSAVLVN